MFFVTVLANRNLYETKKITVMYSALKMPACAVDMPRMERLGQPGLEPIDGFVFEEAHVVDFWVTGLVVAETEEIMRWKLGWIRNAKDEKKVLD